MSDTLRRRTGANTLLAANVAAAAAEVGVRLIHISIDHLFSGPRPMVDEATTPQPLNVYAQTKLAAELEVQNANPKALIVRTNFYGWGHKCRQSFTDRILAALESGSELSIFDGVYLTPTLVDHLVVACHELAQARSSGVFHVVGDDRLSKYGPALEVATAFGFPRDRITRSSIANHRLSASRPVDMSVSTEKAVRVLGHPIGCVREGLADLLEQERTGRRAELTQAVRQTG